MYRATLQEKKRIEERKKYMQELYDSGMTLKEIGKKVGISSQRVSQIIGGQRRVRFRYHTANKVVYSGLRKWMNENKVSVNELTRRLYGNSDPESVRRTRDKLWGKHEFTKTYIDKILKITGQTYEEIFGLEK